MGCGVVSELIKCVSYVLSWKSKKEWLISDMSVSTKSIPMGEISRPNDLLLAIICVILKTSELKTYTVS